MRGVGRRSILMLVLIGVTVFLTPTVAASSPHPQSGRLEVFTMTADADQLAALVAGGYDVEVVEDKNGRLDVQLVLSPFERAVLELESTPLELWRNEDGLTASRLADIQQEEGFAVWRSYDEDGGILDEVYEIARDNPDIIKLRVIGFSTQGRPIVALKVTKDANSLADNSRPAVFYNSLQHAREWISIEVNRRLLHHFVDNYGVDETVTSLVDNHELWFVLTANPDGYEHTFTEGSRFWRKTLRDNDADGEITNADGVDPNRNYPTHWNYDTEGSSSNPGSGTYRGPSPASEPETQATIGMLDYVDFSFMLNFHSHGNLLLYGVGWQVETFSPDQPVFAALSGTDEEPAIPEFDPGVSADLYITNGETCDHAYEAMRTLCWTPELSTGYGFDFPDDEALVQQEFEKVLPFALDIAKSAADPTHPVSHLGNETQSFYLDDFAVSYADRQPVQVNVARDLGPVTMMYRISDGVELSVLTAEWEGGERYGSHDDIYYHKVRGTVAGAKAGDSVTVWFEAGGEHSAEFTYDQAQERAAPVLIIVAEDYRGSLPTYAEPEPRYVSVYLDALAANGLEADVYDLDNEYAAAPHPLGVLGHYDAVIWYTGDDIVPRGAEFGAGTASRWSSGLMLAVRSYLNEGGRLLFTGKYAGYEYGTGGMQYDPAGDADCSDLTVSGCRGHSNDFRQYYLGANSYLRSSDWLFDLQNMAGEGYGLWAGRVNNAWNEMTREFDLTEASGELVLGFDSYWDIEEDWDYGYVGVSTDGGETYANLPDMDATLRDTDPNGSKLEGWGLTERGEKNLRFDLSAYAGVTETVTVRLLYDTDGGVLNPGWWIDDLTLVDASGTIFESDLEMGSTGWAGSGWLQAPQPLPDDVTMYSVSGGAEPFEGLSWEFGAPGAENQDHSAEFNATSQALPPDVYPQFTSWNAAWYDNPAQRAHSGERFVYSGPRVVRSMLRLHRTIDLAGEDEAEMSFWMAHATNVNSEAVVVEARTAGGDDWTTLPDRNRHTSPDTAAGCGTNRLSRYPQLLHYITRDETVDPVECRLTGTTGEWHAASGSSDGWQQWDVDLSGWAGGEVEVAITFFGANATNLSGVMIDDIELSTGETTSFEDGLDDWSLSAVPADDLIPPDTSAFFDATFSNYPTGAAVVTEDTIYFGFGMEGIATDDQRNAVMGRAMEYLLRDRGPEPIFMPMSLRGWVVP